jgi:SAM-dependent methyltransferase
MPTGRVIGVEPRPAMLLAAREFVARAKLENVRLLDTSPARTTLPDESFHLVHERFLLSAGGNEESLLEEMLRVTRPGGFVALQEPDLSSWSCYPDQAGWTRLRDALRVAFSAGGADLDAGSRTFGLLRGAGLEDVRIRAATIALQGVHPAKRYLVDLAVQHRERILDSGALDEDSLVETIAECERVAGDPETIVISFLVSQVWGRKARSRWSR